MVRTRTASAPVPDWTRGVTPAPRRVSNGVWSSYTITPGYTGAREALAVGVIAQLGLTGEQRVTVQRGAGSSSPPSQTTGRWGGSRRCW